VGAVVVPFEVLYALRGRALLVDELLGGFADVLVAFAALVLVLRVLAPGIDLVVAERVAAEELVTIEHLFGARRARVRGEYAQRKQT